MAFQPITYAGQYPPLKPRSPSDVSSFAALHASLRQSLPELAREGDRILNEEMLARFVDGVSRFQRDHLGRKSKSRYWPALRLPSPLLSDRKSYPNGPLGVMVLSAFRIKQVSAWRNFNFDNDKLFDDNVSIIKRMEADLVDRGYLRRPSIYFDASVEAGLGREELRRLTKIALRFGAKVLEGGEALSSGRVTHVVAYDPEEHDAADVIEGERERERRRGGMGEGGVGGDDDDDDEGGGGGGGDGGKKAGGERPYPSEEKFLRTLAVVDAPVPDDGGDDDGHGGGGGGAGTTASSSGGNDGRRKATTRKMALVHWWYHPSSYDEWLPANEVSASVEGEENHHGILPNGGPFCVVGCKFVRDVERFNEWGVEADYAVMEYGRKVACLRPDGVGVGEQEVGGIKSGRTNRGGNNKRAAADDDDNDGEGGAKEKRQRTGQGGGDGDDDDANVEVGASSSSSSSSTTPVVAAPPSSGKSKSKNSGGQVRASPPPGGAASAVGGNRRPTSERRACGGGGGAVVGGGGGMNPRGILTGLRGQRGEVVRRTVHDGALRVEDGAHAVVRDALADYLLGNATATTTAAAAAAAAAAGGGGGRSATTAAAIAPPPRTPTLAARPEWRKLLPATGFVRPSVDASLGCMIVTELTLGERGGEGIGSSSSREDAADVVVGATTATTAMAPTLAANRTVPILIPPEEVAVAVGPGIVVAAAGCGEEGPLTMRGGGGGSEEDIGDGPTWQQQREMADVVDFAMAEDGGGDEDEVIRPPPGGQSPAFGVGVPPNAAMEDAGDLETPESGNNADARRITEPCDDPAAVTEDVAMQVEEEGTASIAPEEGNGEDVFALQADEPPPEEMHAGEDVADTRDAINAGEEMPSELDEDAMHFAGDPTSLSPAESFEEELGAPADDAPPEERPSGERQEIDAPPPVADDGVPCAAAEREPSGPSPEAKLMEVDPSAAVVETYSAAAEVAPEEVDASTKESAVAPLVQGLDSTNDVTDMFVAGKQPSGAMSTSATDIHTAQLHTAPATAGTIQVSSSTAPTPVAPATTDDTPSKTLVAASVLSNSAAKASSIASSSDSIVLCQVVSLPPNTHLYNTLVNNPQSNEGDSKSGPERPSWYHPTKPSEFEKRTLPEWFNCTAPHRSDFTYIATRENILTLAKRNTQQFITSTAVRRSVPGDAGSLLRLHKFLMDFGLLNIGQIGETAPGDAILRGLHVAGGVIAGSKRKHTSAVAWTSDRVHALEASVVKHVSKKTVEGSPDQVNIVVNWDAVASDVGGGATPSDCQSAFVNPPAEDVKTSMSTKNSVFSHIIDGVHPEVLKAVVDASLQSTNDINEARKASFVAIMAGAAAQKGTQAESEIENTLMDIVDLRIQRLENRVALLDDVEALLEAERVSLELERRDMYTARCRHWFGDGSS